MKQTLFFTNPTDLSLCNKQLEIKMTDKDDTKKVFRCIEDIGCIIVDNHSVHITIPLLNELVCRGVSVVFCNSNHFPTSMLMNLDSNVLQAKHFREQIEMGTVIKKQIWKQIIEAKIENQYRLLDKIGLQSSQLTAYSKNVKSGDSTNREGVAAKVYWKMLLGRDFIRDRDGYPPNNLLNYGYSIIRSATIRALLGAGLYPLMGIFHRNYYNSFPLADDIMEPYRPFIDKKVYELYIAGENKITKIVKQSLIEILYEDIEYDGLSMSLLTSILRVSSNFLRMISGESKIMKYPKI
ncbi:MAG: type II CRISPR-associated endonuclease Cas1 [Bacteroidales bacterium]|jgi:CRISP-associated protein Cas1|nr:type II CRISPR-associated endonuclease Cas1 [Bacteroidales bacterium]MDD2205698.1 type II CRISPR-associated endonuclease Cas1 [Bacteroidales bacterium]MDD3915188.1 type II CRISPR-associated endonuclease Cas1 [Bacteroidales bacterium]MDD4634957.1 type II CRISPR-associated endonuclease Cas1 [Bacteroidales bacterium]